MCLTSYIKSAVCFYNDAPNDTFEKERGGGGGCQYKTNLIKKTNKQNKQNMLLSPE